MIHHEGVTLETVQAIYSGPERVLWELLMGEQIHIGGMQSSLALARAAGITPGSQGVDLGCCTGAGMRFLIRCLDVGSMTGVDATPSVVDIGRARNRVAGVGDRIAFIVADACRTDMEDAAADFVWGEDAWCYVLDKEKLIQEAVRLVKPGGVIAFTDWIAGPVEMTSQEVRRFLQFMRFPNMANTEDYRALLKQYGATVFHAEDTGRFAPTMDMYLRVVAEQLAFDVLRILDFNQEAVDVIAGEMAFMRELAHAGKLIQGMFVARKAGA